MLASGSGGNAAYVQSGATALVVDSGLPFKEVRRRLGLIGVDSGGIDAVMVSHGHADHVSGVGPLSRRFGVPVFANAGTIAESVFLSGIDGLERFTTGETVTVGDLDVTAFAVPHDAGEPVGFAISDGQVMVGIATDLGSLTLEVVEGLGGCDAVVLESNHDIEMLRTGPYPVFLKQRIRGALGHLSNDDAGELIGVILHTDLRHLVLAHLSETNNEPGITLESARRALGRKGARVNLTLGWQGRVGEVIDLQ